MHISERIASLNILARNIWWTWNQDAREIFSELSSRTWQNVYHNPVAVLREISETELRNRLLDPNYLKKVDRVLQDFDNYMNPGNTWASQYSSDLQDKSIAYFSAEFGLHETLPIAAGGLGVLAGDHIKSASDLGLEFNGITLFYREGYFQQSINQENWQTEYYNQLNPKNLPMDPVLNKQGEPLVCNVDIASDTVYFRSWRINVGRCPLYLLDTNLPENKPHYRDLTLRVYGGDSTTRIQQEILLGVGGVKLMRALEIQPSVFHMNEGHAAFLSFELIKEKLINGQSFEAAMKETRSECIFTTHTPVPAGHDRFDSELMRYALSSYEKHLNLSHEELMGLGRLDSDDTEETFCMTVLALNTSKHANGVSELHGSVSREMWKDKFKLPKEEVPIGHITNGIHLLGWMSAPARNLWQSKIGDTGGFYEQINTPEFWAKAEDSSFVSDEELWALRYRLRRGLIDFTRNRLIGAPKSREGDFISYDQLLDADTLTIGFARRFATYKRAPLIFDKLDKVVKLAKDPERPVQFIFAGKAHPADDEGKRFIQKIAHLSKQSGLSGQLVFIENYDIEIGRMLVGGCDVWLNNPRRPMEASGTSGMKTAAHGGLNCSIMDGWWREVFDGDNGFSIGDDGHPDDIEEQDRVDSENLFRVLSEEVIPTFYNRDANGIPRAWIKKIRHAMATIAPRYNTWRMVQNYSEKYYNS
ncbi:MAG: alpha-glucan phosphorylase [Verrucomicrobiales bacterium]|nr:alpha-glucan phosphorylase [Verrucomicrobiales bacterium]